MRAAVNKIFSDKFLIRGNDFLLDASTVRLRDKGDAGIIDNYYY